MTRPVRPVPVRPVSVRIIVHSMWLHLVAIALFLGSRAVMTAAGTNRTAIDASLAAGGFIVGLGALTASLLATALVLLRPEARRAAAHLIAHAGLVALIVLLASRWMAEHIA